MKNSFLLFLFVFLFTRVEAQNFSYNRDYERILIQTSDSNSKVYYPILLNRFNRLDTTLTNSEMLALMIGFTGQPKFDPYTYLSAERKIYDLNDEGEFVEAITVCDSFLALYPLSQQALIEKSYAFYKLGMQDSSSYYSDKFTLIMQTMDWSGDGLTPETAKFAIGPADGQNFIQKYYHAKIGFMGSGKDKYGNFCDILEKINKQNQDKVILYFVIEHATKVMKEQLRQAIPKK